MKLFALLMLSACGLTALGQTIDPSYNQYDFTAGEKTLFEDTFSPAANEKPLGKWALQGGKATVVDHQGEKCLSIDEYYTKLKPVLFSAKPLPDSVSVEYDTWLDSGYDGNPGVEIHFVNGDNEVVITPNKHELTVSYPSGERAAKENPDAYFGEGKFYDRWVHVSISLFKKALTVYLDQFKLIELADCNLKPQGILVTGNSSQNMKMLLKNFRIATGFRRKIAFENGKFVTRAIKFDVNKASLKPESITILREIHGYLTQNPNVRLEIGGHTDSDGTDDYNLKLSQQRAEAVNTQLTAMGIAQTRLQAKGYGETKPLDPKNTPDAKATNRRVEFTMLK